MGWLDALNPTKTNPLDPYSIYRSAKSGSKGAPAPAVGKYSSQDPNNLYPAGTDPNRNKESGLAYGLPFQLRSTYGAYPGVDTLNDILAHPGQTDEKLFNESLAANSRATGASQDAARAGLNRSGYGGSGLGMALQAAIGQAGANQEGSLYANEARRREELKRSDLDFLNQYYVNPKLSVYGANKGVSIANDQSRTAKKGAAIGGTAALAAALIGAFAGCATADELYGVGSEEANLARYYMAFMAEPETRTVYGTGKALAARVRRNPALRREVRPIFDGFVDRARRAWAA